MVLLLSAPQPALHIVLSFSSSGVDRGVEGLLSRTVFACLRLCEGPPSGSRTLSAAATNAFTR